VCVCGRSSSACEGVFICVYVVSVDARVRVCLCVCVLYKYKRTEFYNIVHLLINAHRLVLYQ